MNSMENSGYKVFLGLQHKISDNGFIAVEAVPFSQYHKIGISSEGFPLFFVKCDDQEKSININLELISVLFSQECNIKENKNNTSGTFTIVLLKTINRDLQQYFTDVFSIILQQIKSIPTEKELYKEVRKVIELFSVINKPPVKSLQGLWAELLVIEKSTDHEYLINAWHSSPLDKFDFNDGKDKLEVKSTTKSNRNHAFSLEQLINNSGSKLLIASTYVIETGVGKSILNLRDSIMTKLFDLNTQLKLNEIIYKTVGNNYSKLGQIYFDYQLASDSLVFYDIVDIPKIPLDSIPEQISNIKFDCNLTNILTITDKEDDLNKYKLFKSLGL